MAKTMSVRWAAEHLFDYLDVDSLSDVHAMARLRLLRWALDGVSAKQAKATLTALAKQWGHPSIVEDFFPRKAKKK